MVYINAYVRQHFSPLDVLSDQAVQSKYRLPRVEIQRLVERLPRLYDPGPEVTVDEQLLAFRGRCPFKQYMPSKPAKYGIKSWVACDAKSSYAWKMQVYTGKQMDGVPERNQGMRVVLDVRGPEGSAELPSELLTTKTRRVLSLQFAFTPTTTLVSYLAKENKNVLLMSTRHTDAEISDRNDGKPTIVLDYNRNKGGVDNLDKVITAYSCKRKTARWLLVIFSNIVDVSSYDAFVIWRSTPTGYRVSATRGGFSSSSSKGPSVWSQIGVNNNLQSQKTIRSRRKRFSGA
ncbi:piggyBac transposable element-derived protein 4-like [Osmerus eperlanus]|uniref:piggyBac transposable element-derived protein 4-like n=1 Tax=Osmerus eperlanus TaxID=29151 RepID=UPI002E164A96